MEKKRFWTVLLLCMAFLCACGKTEKKEQAKNLEFPELTWDMTPEDVMKVFQTTKENTVLYDEDSYSFTTVFGIEDVDVFGQKAERVLFNFVDYASFAQLPWQEEGKPCLCGIRVYYPQDADMASVKEQMEQTYGATVSEYYPFDRQIDLENNQSMRLEPWKESESVQYWGSSILGDVLSEDDMETYKTSWENCRAGLNEENWEFFKDHARMVSVIFSDQEGEVGKGLEWDAHNLVVYQVLNRQKDE